MPAVPAPRQLTLALGHAESFAREDFLRGTCNAAALALVDNWPDWPNRIMAICGPPGAGKSHLAAIWGERSGARFLAGRSLTRDMPPAALATGALVLEDLAPGRFEEPALFHLINLARQDGAYLLLTVRESPTRWPVGLPDLASRLRAIPVVTLAPPDDDLLAGVIAKLFADRQIVADDALIRYLMARVERAIPAVRAAVERLDREAMQRKRPVNRALAADLYRDE